MIDNVIHRIGFKVKVYKIPLNDRGGGVTFDSVEDSFDDVSIGFSNKKEDK